MKNSSPENNFYFNFELCCKGCCEMISTRIFKGPARTLFNHEGSAHRECCHKPDRLWRYSMPFATSYESRWYTKVQKNRDTELQKQGLPRRVPLVKPRQHSTEERGEANKQNIAYSFGNCSSTGMKQNLHSVNQ